MWNIYRKICFVGTDAYKLVKHIRNDFSFESNSSFILPKKPLTLLKNILTEDLDIKIEYNETNAMFIFDSTKVICRLIDGKYPNYGRLYLRKIQTNLLSQHQNYWTPLKEFQFTRINNTSDKTLYQGQELQISSEDLDFANQLKKDGCQYVGQDMEIELTLNLWLRCWIILVLKILVLKWSSNRLNLLPLDGQEGET